MGIPLTGSGVPPILKGVRLKISVAGQTHQMEFPPQPNQNYTFIWDGLDAYGRPVSGSAMATVEVSYVYPLVYYSPAFGSLRSFARSTINGAQILAVREDQEFGISRSWTVQLTGSKGFSSRVGLGGWSLSVYHELDAADGMLYRGNGDRRDLRTGSGWLIQTAAGGGDRWPVVDGEDVSLFDIWPVGIDVADDGSIYTGDDGYIYRIGLDGRLTLLAGNGSNETSCEDGVGLEMPLNNVFEVKLAPNGDLYFIENGATCIRKLTTDGKIRVVAGSDEVAYGGDEGPARDATFADLDSLEVAADGSVYLTDENRIRKIGPDGVIHTFAGSSTAGFGGDGGFALNALFDHPLDLAIAADGSLYVADTGNHCVRHIGVSGLVSTVAGICGTAGSTGSASEATSSYLNWPYDIDIGSDGTLYIADKENQAVYEVDDEGIISIAAGNGVMGHDGDGGLASAASVGRPNRLASAPDGSLYISQPTESRLRRRFLYDWSADPVRIPSADGSSIYRFEGGRHVATLDALTANERYRFSFDQNERLVAVTDIDGEVTTIERDSEGRPLALVAPNGQRTALDLDENGYLSEITNPAGEQYRFGYANAGLLTTMTDPLDRTRSYAYDASGRLVTDRDSAGGGWDLERRADRFLYTGTTTTLTSQEGRRSTFRKYAGWISTQTTTAPDGTVTTAMRFSDGTRHTALPDGSTHQESYAPDPRFGMSSPVTSTERLSLSGFSTYQVSTARSKVGGSPSDPFDFDELSETVETPFGETRTVYNAAERKQTVTTPKGRVTTTWLNERGRLQQVEYPGGNRVNFEYDERGRLAAMTASDGEAARSTTLQYDALGNLAALEDPIGRRTEIDYDLSGRPIRRRLPGERTVSYEYDAAGNLLALTTPGGDSHRFAYEGRDLEAAYTPPELNPERDPATRYRYNLDKELVEVARPDGRILTIEYDDKGHQVAVRRSAGTTAYSYDDTTGKLIGITAPDGGTLAFAYMGPLLESERWSGEVNGAVSRDYWDDYLMLDGLSVNGLRIRHDYNQDGQLTYAGDAKLYYQSGSGWFDGVQIGEIDTYPGYNGFGELTEEQVEISGSPILETRYTRDPLGRITERVESLDGPDRTERYTYDTAGRLTEVERDGETTTYTYDANGNRLSREGPDGVETGLYDAQDRLVAYADADYTYTANGELASRTDGSGTTLYSYDTVGNLTSVTLSDDVVIDYLIDGRNRRIGKKVGGVLVQGFLYRDQLNPVAELDGDNSVVSYFVYADKSNVPAYMVKGGINYAIISDHLGSPKMVIDSNTGAVV
ncbi:NHL domain-containing protein, partial [Endothiovibrio diazotrophicus]